MEDISLMLYLASGSMESAYFSASRCAGPGQHLSRWASGGCVSTVHGGGVQLEDWRRRWPVDEKRSSMKLSRPRANLGTAYLPSGSEPGRPRPPASSSGQRPSVDRFGNLDRWRPGLEALCIG